ncbi:hypothetical protein CR513_29176, partial [Mucuna pruriens]
MLEKKDNWDILLHLVEFTYNNSYYSNIGMTPYEASDDKRSAISIVERELEGREGKPLEETSKDRERG